MSEQTLQAVYLEGHFQPTTPDEVTLNEGTKVNLLIQTIDDEAESETARTERVARILNLIEHFYDGVDDDEIDEIERASLDRVNFVDPDKKAKFD